MMRPLISVLMPVYNSEDYLKQAIESILNQTFTNFEFLIFDDGSTDKSKEIILKYAEKDSRIIFFLSPENQGYTKHLNKGLEIAKGKYIARMDSDDICLPNRLQMQVNFMEKNEKVWVLGASSLIIDKDANEVGISTRITDPEKLYFISFFINPLSHPTVIFRKDQILKIGGYNNAKVPSEDFDLWVKVLGNGKIANLETPLLKYREHGESISSKKKELQKKYSQETLQHLWKQELNVNLNTYEILFLKEFHNGYDELPKEMSYPLFIKILRLIAKCNKKNDFNRDNELTEFILKRLIYLILNSRHHSYFQMFKMSIKAFVYKPQTFYYLLNK